MARQNFPPDRVRISSSFFSSLVWRGSVFFRITGEMSGSGYPKVVIPISSAPSFQICLHRVHRQVLRRGYTLSQEQTGQVGMVILDEVGTATLSDFFYPVCAVRIG